MSKILEGKDSKLTDQMDLRGSKILCDDAAREVVDKLLFNVTKKTKKVTLSSFQENLTALLFFFFVSCAKSEELRVLFPASAPVPNWFTYREGLRGDAYEVHEFCIEIPQRPNC